MSWYPYEDIQIGNLIDIQIDADTVMKVGSELPSASAPGEDGIRSKDISDSKHGTALPLARIFRNSLDYFEGLENTYALVLSY